MARRSPAVVVTAGVEKNGGSLIARDVHDFKAQTDCPLSIRDIIDGLRVARNRGWLKLAKRDGCVTRVRRTGKSLRR